MEVIEALDAYCKLSMKTFVVNICRQVRTQRHIIRNLDKVFHPFSVGTLFDAGITKLEVRDRN
ncbi:hypothetical protein BDV12DRAFT_178805 [Aspergillus spectabilis]